MRHRFILGIAALALVLTACSTTPAGLTAEDEAAIETFHNVWTQLLLARDFDALETLYTEDTVTMSPNMPALEGIQAVRAWFDGYPEITAMELTTLEVDGRGDLAYARGIFEMTVVVEGVSMSDTGKFIEILRKQEDGSWLMAVDIFNSDIPLPE